MPTSAEELRPLPEAVPPAESNPAAEPRELTVEDLVRWFEDTASATERTFLDAPGDARAAAVEHLGGDTEGAKVIRLTFGQRAANLRERLRERLGRKPAVTETGSVDIVDTDESTDETEATPELEAIVQKQAEVMAKMRTIILQIGVRELGPVLDKLNQNPREVLKQYNSEPKGAETTDGVKTLPLAALVDPVLLADIRVRLTSKLREPKAAKPGHKKPALPEGVDAQQYALEVKKIQGSAVSKIARLGEGSSDYGTKGLEAVAIKLPVLLATLPLKAAEWGFVLSGRGLTNAVDLLRGDTRSGKQVGDPETYVQVADVSQRIKLLDSLRSTELDLNHLRNDYFDQLDPNKPTPTSFERHTTRLEATRRSVDMSGFEALPREQINIISDLTTQRLFRLLAENLNPDQLTRLMSDPANISDLLQVGPDGGVMLNGSAAAVAAENGLTLTADDVKREVQYAKYLVQHEKPLREAAKLYMLSSIKGRDSTEKQLSRQAIIDGQFSMDIDSAGHWSMKLLIPSQDDAQYFIADTNFSTAVFQAVDEGKINTESNEIDAAVMRVIMKERSAKVQPDEKVEQPDTDADAQLNTASKTILDKIKDKSFTVTEVSDLDLLTKIRTLITNTELQKKPLAIRYDDSSNVVLGITEAGSYTRLLVINARTQSNFLESIQRLLPEEIATLQRHTIAN